MAYQHVTEPTTLSPLPPILQRGLVAVSFFGFLSFLTSIALFLRLAYRLVTWKRKTQARVNQFIILIFNFVPQTSSMVGTPTCWAQGWFVSTGDLASGVFTFAIAVHSFLDIVWDYRLAHRPFLAVIAGLWTFVYACAIIGVAIHPDGFYVRAGAWCWINYKYSTERLWLHYFWVIISEFGTVIVYTLIFLILRRRVKESFYTTSDTQLRAQSAAKLIIAYPIVYVVCTLPLVIARLTSMTGGSVSFIELCVAGAMITSNGWLDVVLYTLTRRALIFGPEMAGEHSRALDTFRLRPDQAYGTTTTIEASHIGRRPSSRRKVPGELPSHSRHGSTEELFDWVGVKTETTVQVRTDTMELDPIAHRASDPELRGSRVSFDSQSGKSGK